VRALFYLAPQQSFKSVEFHIHYAIVNEMKNETKKRGRERRTLPDSMKVYRSVCYIHSTRVPLCVGRDIVCLATLAIQSRRRTDGRAKQRKEKKYIGWTREMITFIIWAPIPALALCVCVCVCACVYILVSSLLSRRLFVYLRIVFMFMCVRAEMGRRELFIPTPDTHEISKKGGMTFK
jgi:hypothetical protein